MVSGPFAILAATGIVLSAIYLLWAYQRAMHGETREIPHARYADLTRRESAALVPVVVLILAIGVFPSRSWTGSNRPPSATRS